MPYWNRQDSYAQDPAILQSPENVSTPITVAIYKSTFGFDTNLKQRVPAGLFLSRVGNTYRFLPRTTASQDAAQNTLNLTLNQAYLFVPGDQVFKYSTTAAVPTPVLIGTIQSINYQTQVATLIAGAAAGVNAGDGIQVPQDEILGIYPKSSDFLLADMQLYAPITKAEGIYQDALPFYDAQLEDLFKSVLGIRKLTY